MNAAEIIDQIKQLPLEEQGKVLDFARHLPNAETLEAMAEAEHPEKLERFESAEDLFKKLNVRFKENSTYSCEQAPTANVRLS